MGLKLFTPFRFCFLCCFLTPQQQNFIAISFFLRYYEKRVKYRAGVVQWQNTSFPSWIRGSDSPHPLQKKEYPSRVLFLFVRDIEGNRTRTGIERKKASRMLFSEMVRAPAWAKDGRFCATSYKRKRCKFPSPAQLSFRSPTGRCCSFFSCGYIGGNRTRTGIERKKASRMLF